LRNCRFWASACGRRGRCRRATKGAAGLIGLIRKGAFVAGQRVVFLHTGGAIGLTGYTHVLPGPD